MDRNTEIVKLWLEPGQSLATVAKRFGLSRERVRQIASKQGIRKPKTKAIIKLCPECGKKIDKRCNYCRDCWNKRHNSRKLTNPRKGIETIECPCCRE